MSGKYVELANYLIMSLSGILAGIAVLASLIRKDFLGTAGGILLFVMAGVLNIAITSQRGPAGEGDSGTILAMTALILLSWQLVVLSAAYRCFNRQTHNSNLEDAHRLRG